MSYAELIEILENLPEEKQVEVLDFAKFLAEKAKKEELQPKTLTESSLA